MSQETLPQQWLDHLGERPVHSRGDSLARLRHRGARSGFGNWEKLGYETREFYLISGRGRYELGEFRWGIAIRKRDGRIIRWDFRDREERQADYKEWKRGGSRAVRARRKGGTP